jgi:hypothetical protein
LLIKILNKQVLGYLNARDTLLDYANNIHLCKVFLPGLAPRL